MKNIAALVRGTNDSTKPNSRNRTTSFKSCLFGIPGTFGGHFFCKGTFAEKLRILMLERNRDFC